MPGENKHISLPCPARFPLLKVLATPALPGRLLMVALAWRVASSRSRRRSSRAASNNGRGKTWQHITTPTALLSAAQPALPAAHSADCWQHMSVSPTPPVTHHGVHFMAIAKSGCAVHCCRCCQGTHSSAFRGKAAFSQCNVRALAWPKKS